MRIASVDAKLGSSFTQTQSLDIRQSVTVTQQTAQPAPQDNVQLSSQGVQSLMALALQNDISGLLSLIKAIVEKAFGIHIWLWDNKSQPATGQAPSAPASPPPQVDAEQSVDYQDKQQLQFSANGQVTTQDSKQFQFSLNLSMQSLYQYHSSAGSQNGGQPHDPLMISLGADAGRFSGATASFDLQNNGQMTQLPFPTDGGWLVLDKNGSGKVGNGSELFGPQSGNGFADLAKYDVNHDGVIDESDPVYAQLRIWTGRGSDGKDQLETLQQAHIGAILLPSVQAPLTMRQDSASIAPTAQMESAGVYLKDDGQAGMVSQVDVYG
ncbi:hypothetical protein [Chromobacterium sp. ASV23]|uniref:hypothetical protein n=1 Tax=Chromobacterium sp. ASV23 TaxID=2795110 RepID=UPI0018EBA70B|nr:hypothetical protein [Chromobacterium sp. ASV23]